jgi:hypothetical protein
VAKKLMRRQQSPSPFTHEFSGSMHKAMELKDKLPWQVRIVAKLILSRLPMKYGDWSKIAFFKHGLMEKPEYAYEVVRTHFEKLGSPRSGKDFVVMEIGPGDSLFSAMIARAFGASGVYLVDVGDFACKDLRPYLHMEDFLRNRGLTPPILHELRTLPDLLKTCNAKYMTSGIESLRSIPDQSVDFIWSQAVLEHIRRSEFEDTIREFRRIIRDDGMASHSIDLRDHLGGTLNNLRFSDRIWESDFMVRSGFYTNRIRYSEMLRLFEKMNFEAKTTVARRWGTLPTPRNKFSAGFKQFSDAELCVSVFDVILRPV